MKKNSKSPKTAQYANRIRDIQPSGLRKLFDLEYELLKSSDLKILSFGLGNLNIPVMPEIIEQLKKELNEPISHSYTSNAGLLELRIAIADKYLSQYQIDYNPEQVLVTSGCLEALFDTFLTLVDPNDEVLIPDPAFGYYRNQVRICGGKIISLPLNERFELDCETVNEAITSKTKILLLNFPCNPTGSVMSRQKMKNVIETANDAGILIIADEAYEGLTYENHRHVSAAEFDQENVLILSSFSKTYCMTGFRIGYIIGSLDYIKPISLIHQLNTACASTPSQIAAKIALQSHPSIRTAMLKELSLRRIEVIKAFTSIDGISLNYNPLGAFYIYPEISGTEMTGKEFSEYALNHAKIVVVPGDEFGDITTNNIRVSYGYLSVPEIKEAGFRLKKCLENV